MQQLSDQSLSVTHGPEPGSTTKDERTASIMTEDNQTIATATSTHESPNKVLGINTTTTSSTTTSAVNVNNSFIKKQKPFLFASPLVKNTSINTNTNQTPLKNDISSPLTSITPTLAPATPIITTTTATATRPSVSTSTFKKNTVTLNLQSPNRQQTLINRPIGLGINNNASNKSLNSSSVSVQYMTDDDQEQCLKLQNAQSGMWMGCMMFYICMCVCLTDIACIFNHYQYRKYCLL